MKANIFVYDDYIKKIRSVPLQNMHTLVKKIYISRIA